MEFIHRFRMKTWFAVSLILALAGCGNDGSSSERLQILVTTDDGVSADGLDILVQALVADPRNEVTVCAPDGVRSSTGDATGPSERCGNLSVTAAATLSGYPATAINGCPADAVNYALTAIYPQDAPPHLVISGLNAGQNVSEFFATQISGTVGAAKTAVRRGVPALAASQGVPKVGAQYDYPAGVAAVLTWLDENRAALLAGGMAPSDVDSINIPTCDTGSIRGTIVGLPLSASHDAAAYPQNCASTLDDPRDDVEALLNGFITLTKVPLD